MHDDLKEKAGFSTQNTTPQPSLRQKPSGELQYLENELVFLILAEPLKKSVL